jgi:hypothetical protein
VNTAPGLPQVKSRQIERLVEQKDSGPSATSAAALEAKLEAEKAERKQERFIWILVVTGRADCVSFEFLDPTGPSFFVTTMSLIMRMVCAR